MTPELVAQLQERLERSRLERAVQEEQERVKRLKAMLVRWAPRPSCCVAVDVAIDNDRSEGLGVVERPLVRLSEHEETTWLVGGHKAAFCPFCGARLPAVELDPDAKGPFRDFDKNGICITCDERYCCGKCLPRSARFRIKSGPEAACNPAR